MRQAQLIGRLCFLVLVCFLWVGAATAADSPPPRPAFPRAPIEIQRADGSRASFDVEWAISPEAHAYGLMYRKNLSNREGMLFFFAAPQSASFWMKNTFIPLDLIFISPQKRIVQIVAQAQPLDETPMASSEPVSFVLEIPGGQAQAQHLSVGDILLLPYKK